MITVRAGQWGRHAGANCERVEAGASGGTGKTGDRWEGRYNNTGRATSGKVPIIFGTYNICNGCKGGLDAALRGISQANMDLGILQEKNSLMGSTPVGRPDIASSRRMRRADTAATSHSSTAPNHTSWWRRWRSLDPMYLGSSLRRGREGGTSWGCTSRSRTQRRWSG